ncbi:hypothetical protein VPH35_107889 [Triticum aestivum]
MDIDTICPLCFRYDEDAGHLFLECKTVKGIWRYPLLEHIRLRVLECLDSFKFMEEILELNEEGRLKTCILLWMCCYQRNRANVGDRVTSNDELCFSINHYLVNALDNVQPSKHTRQNTIQRRISPPLGIVKLITHGAFQEETFSRDWCFTLRNDTGALIAAGAGNLEYLVDALHSEALAMLHAVDAAIRMGL